VHARERQETGHPICGQEYSQVISEDGGAE